MKVKMMIFMISIACVLSACKAGESITSDKSGDRVNSIASEQNQSANPISEEINVAISNHIIQKNSAIYFNTEKQFEVHHVYGTSESNGILSVYMHSYFGGYNKSSGLENQAGHSLPAVIRLQKKASGYAVVEYIEPEDGDLYQSSLKKMFPEKYLKMIVGDAGHINDLRVEMDNQVKHWLGADEQSSSSPTN
ncbi:hypothetical protein [Paenibacillus sinopodophylli]|uniref:hypothetical protein n=1 Tax=Paenibacillus sinopodophylli TaxID=1837342 RepID=UPI00110D21F4|nr:hypothetical protein [Paenibacillus sinopodophylli]